MLEHPDVDDAKIIDCLTENYGLKVVDLSFLPIGNDVNSGAFRVRADSTDTHYYLKLRRGPFDQASVAVPAFLADGGSTHVIPPLPTRGHELQAHLRPFTLVLYPFVEGRNAFQIPLTPSLWTELGVALKGLHSTVLPAAVQALLPRESFSVPSLRVVTHLLARIERETFQEPTAATLAEFIKSKRDVIRLIVRRAESLAHVLGMDDETFVPCHVLVDGHGGLFLVDWDTLVLAPKERDLMFIGAGVGGAWNQREEAILFYQGYGQAPVDHRALDYYRSERIVEDIAAYGEEILLTDAGGQDRGRGFKKFRAQFEPGNVVDAALTGNTS